MQDTTSFVVTKLNNSVLQLLQWLLWNGLANVKEFALMSVVESKSDSGFCRTVAV